MLYRLLIAVVLFLVLNVATATPTVQADHNSLTKSVEVDIPVVDIRCNGYAAFWYQLRPQIWVPRGINGVNLILYTDDEVLNPSRWYKTYGDLDGVVRTEEFSDVLTTEFSPLKPGTRVYWSLDTWWMNATNDYGAVLDQTQGSTICSTTSVPTDRVAIQVNWHGQNINNAAVRIWDSSVPWQETTWADGEAGWTSFFIPGYDGRSLWLQVCVREDNDHWITRPGPYRPTPELMRPDGTFVIPLVLDGLSGELVSNGWCDQSIDWSRYN